MTVTCLIRGGTVIDPAAGLHGEADVAIAVDRVHAVGEALDVPDGVQVIDATGRLVTPGWIDLHVHVWDGVAHLGIPADPNCVGRGVTTAFDAGSAGADTFPGFSRYVIDVAQTRIRAFLHLSSQGQLTQDIGELDDLRWADVPRAQQICAEYREQIVGIKIRMTKNLVGDNGREVLQRARALCEATGLPLMLHPNAAPMSMAEMLSQLAPGDIVTHCFHASDTGVLDESATVRPEVLDAVERGIHFDVGHGAGSFSFAVAEAARRQGLHPGTISSDLHRYNLHGPVYDLATTISKFLLLGDSLETAIERVTAAPARTMGMLDEIGALRPGSCADVSIFEVHEGTFEFADALGETRTGECRLVPVETLRAGRRVPVGDTTL